MEYWIIKGNPAANDWDAMLQPGATGLWHTGRTPKNWSARDRVFFWESTPKLRIIALGLILDTNCGNDEYGDTLFRVQYLTRRLSSMADIHELRKTPIVNKATFLKAGPATTLFPITDEQAEILFTILCGRNPELQNIWPDLEPTNYSGVLPDVDAWTQSAKEGSLKLVTHLMRERNRKIVTTKKQQVLAATGKLICETCGFDFQDFYGNLGQGFCEVHHKLPLSQVENASETRLNDLAILCSNCHRMIHKTNPLMAVEQFKQLIKKLA
jgi:5-methylcytosine-specific restriction endonuclease McrA